MKKFGLFGYPLSHSFSKKFFSEKFEKEGHNDYVYDNYENANAGELKKIIFENPELIGLNVTIPHKLDIMPMMDHADDVAQRIGAVNCIKIIRNGSGKAEPVSEGPPHNWSGGR